MHRSFLSLFASLSLFCQSLSLSLSLSSNFLSTAQSNLGKKAKKGMQRLFISLSFFGFSFFGVSRILLLLFLSSSNLAQTSAITDEETISLVEQVFPPLHGATLSGQGSAGVAQLKPLLETIASTGCPFFSTSQAWQSKELMHACLLAVLGKFAAEEGGGGGNSLSSSSSQQQQWSKCQFSLDTRRGTIVRNSQLSTVYATSETILSALIVTLLLAVVMTLFVDYIRQW